MLTVVEGHPQRSDTSAHVSHGELVAAALPKVEGGKICRMPESVLHRADQRS